MSYVAATYTGPAASYSSPRPNSHEEDYNGAYGRDGAPSSRFMSPIEAAYAVPIPQRPNVASAERAIPQSRLLHDAIHPPSSVRSPSPSSYTRNFSPAPDYSLDYSPPSTLLSLYQDTHDQHSSYGEDLKLLAPRLAFVEPKIKAVDASGASLVYGKGKANFGRFQEKSQPSIGDDPDGEEVWHRIERRSNAKLESTWLSSQHAAGSKFRSSAWFVTMLLLVVMGGAIAYALMHHSPPTAPRALEWANGAKEVPSFGVDSTATANNRSATSDATTSNSLGARSPSTRLQTRNHHSHAQFRHELD